ncbi:hypothetical protein IEN85_06395 [Pelagicoccus sp. NFK12]|uniref:TonB C-terminal domain-containing protein n=1 Tax=Pelagicoccus enzymogenes TaxID=2773457 RepID=A0A927IGF8_9BACT|nr:hypothetical protein [Pelagicoccus enzymogenes]MBD5779116.1 hypothetical protein [Pelagicoccus enzymogenes]
MTYRIVAFALFLAFLSACNSTSSGHSSKTLSGQVVNAVRWHGRPGPVPFQGDPDMIDPDRAVIQYPRDVSFPEAVFALNNFRAPAGTIIQLNFRILESGAIDYVNATSKELSEGELLYLEQLVANLAFTPYWHDQFPCYYVVDCLLRF